MPGSESDARLDVLNGIRTALRSSQDPARIAFDYASIPKGYKRTATRSREEIVRLFEHRLREYDAGVYRASADGISGKLAEILSGRTCKRVVIPEGLERSWLPEGFEFMAGTQFDNYELDQIDGVLTGCTIAIAETGSVVMQNALGQGPRILSLIPDYHLCVVFAEQVVETVPEAFASLEASSSLPTTFFSGPSATADIEMTRIKGVHGPRFLDVLLVE